MAVVISGQLICATLAEAQLVEAHLREHARLTRAEAGCVSFEVRQTNDPLLWEVREEFVDGAALEAHQARTARSAWAKATAGIKRAYIRSER
jgi:quinol monooxygenase YgiN